MPIIVGEEYEELCALAKRENWHVEFHVGAKHGEGDKAHRDLSIIRLVDPASPETPWATARIRDGDIEAAARSCLNQARPSAAA